MIFRKSNHIINKTITNNQISRYGVVSCKILCNSLIIMYLGLKPLIDLTWRYKFLGLNLQSALNLIIPTCLLFLIVIANPFRLLIRKEFAVFYLFVLFVSVSIIINSSDLNHIATTSRLLLNVIFLYAMCKYFSVDDLYKIRIFFSISMFSLCFLGMLQLLGILPYEYFMYSLIPGVKTGRVSGTYSHPTDFIRIALFYVIFYLCLLKANNNLWYKIVYIFTIGIILFTYHRAALAVMLIIHFIHYLIWRKYLRIVFAGFFLTIIVIVKLDFFTYSIIEKRLNFSEGIENSRFSYAYQSYYLYKSADTIHKLFGSGSFPDGRLFGDCDYMRILYSHGIIAFCLYFVFIGTSLILGFRKKNPLMKQILLFPLLTLFMLSITSDPLRYPSFLIFLFAFLSVGQKRQYTTEYNRINLKIAL